MERIYEITRGGKREGISTLFSPALYIFKLASSELLCCCSWGLEMIYVSCIIPIFSCQYNVFFPRKKDNF